MLSSEEASEEAIAKTGLYHRVSHHGEGRGRPLVVMVHGRTGNANVMWTFSRVFERHEVFAVAPQAFLDDELGGFSWWRVGNEDAGRSLTDEAIAPAMEKLETFIRAAVKFYGTKDNEIYAMGFSQGAALCGALSLRNPELFRAVVLLAGFVPGAAFKESQKSAALPKYFIAHGSKDETVSLERAEAAKTSLEALGADVRFSVEDVGHKVGSQSLREIQTWFDGLLDGPGPL